MTRAGRASEPDLGLTFGSASLHKLVAPGRLAHAFSETQVGSFYSPHLCSPHEVPPPTPSRVSVSDVSRICSTGSVPVWLPAWLLGPQDSRRRRPAVTLGNLSSARHLGLRNRTRPQTFLVIENAALPNS